MKWVKSILKVLSSNKTMENKPLWKIFAIFSCLIMGIVVVVMPSGVMAWPSDPTVNVPICTEDWSVSRPRMVSDENGGSIIIWYHSLSRTIYAQRVDSNGNVLWQPNGLPLYTASVTNSPSAVGDGAGGVIITWATGWNRGVYAQRVDSDGKVKWQSNGVLLSNSESVVDLTQVAIDGFGGALIVWDELQEGWSPSSDWRVYAQRVDSNGNVLWTQNGVPISTNGIFSSQQSQIVSDGSGGAIITWHAFSGDIYAQRVDSDGKVKWQSNGVPVCTAENWQGYPKILKDGSGGAIITWRDARSGNEDVYAQRVDSNGNVLWQPNGVPICTAEEQQAISQLIGDGSGGAIIVWLDRRSDEGDIYAQCVDSNGNVLWQPNGVPICTAEKAQWDPQIVSDYYGGAIITWYDFRSETGIFLEDGDIYAQRVDSNGNVLWQQNGVPICTAEKAQWGPQIVSDYNNGAIITWEDYRNGQNWSIYAQNVNPDGTLGPVDTGSISIPYIRQAGDTDALNDLCEGFDGRWACGATSAVMITSYYQRLNSNPITVYGVDNACGAHTSDYGWYVSSKYSRYGYNFDEKTPDYKGKQAYGAYGYIHDENSIANAEHARGYFRRHGIFSKIISTPTEADVKNEIDKGHPIWASTNLWQGGHIVVIKGYSNTGYYVADPWPPKEKRLPEEKSYCADGSNKFYTWYDLGHCMDSTSDSRSNCTYPKQWIPGPKWIVTTDPIAVGDEVTTLYSGIVHVKKGPGLENDDAAPVRNEGDTGIIIDDSTYGPFYNSDTDSNGYYDHYTWWKILWNNGDEGWSQVGDGGYGENWLEKIGTTRTLAVSLTAKPMSSSSIVLSWRDNSNTELGFKIERKEGSCDSANTWRQIAKKGANITTHTNGELTPNTTYSYRVRAYSADNNSAYSNCASAKTALLGTPKAPINLQARSLSPSQIKLLWTDNSTDEKSFKIYRKVGTGSWSLLATKGADIVSHTDTTAGGNTATTTYSYYVKACNSSGCSPATNIAVVSYKPTNLEATASSSCSIDLIWEDKSSNETGFQIYRKTGICSSTNPWSKITTEPNITSYNITGLTSGTTYSYKVGAYKKSSAVPYAYGYSVYSNCKSVTTP